MPSATRASKINLSARLEQALIEKLREAQQRQWRDDLLNLSRGLRANSSSNVRSLQFPVEPVRYLLAQQR